MNLIILTLVLVGGILQPIISHKCHHHHKHRAKDRKHSSPYAVPHPFVGSIGVMKPEDKGDYLPDFKFVGAATMLTQNWAVTAAHCVYTFDADLLGLKIAYVRGNTRYWSGPHGRDHLITNCIVHSNFTRKGLQADYDIALLQVKEPFDGIFEKPISYARSSYRYVATSSLYSLRWGRRRVTRDLIKNIDTDELKIANVNLVKEATCMKSYRNETRVALTPRMVCATAPRDICKSYSGGPLVQHEKRRGKMTLIGVHSFGFHCATNQYPAIYTNISQFDKWISAILKPKRGSSKIAGNTRLKLKRGSVKPKHSGNNRHLKHKRGNSKSKHSGNNHHLKPKRGNVKPKIAGNNHHLKPKRHHNVTEMF